MRVPAELALPFEAKGLEVGKLEQKEAWFTAINPNGRIPALVDHNEGDLAVFESGVRAAGHLCAARRPADQGLWAQVPRTLGL